MVESCDDAGRHDTEFFLALHDWKGQAIGFSISTESAGVEYYADYGRFFKWDSLHNEQQQFFAVTDLNVSSKWQFNLGLGLGVTASTDHFLIKALSGADFHGVEKARLTSFACE